MTKPSSSGSKGRNLLAKCACATMLAMPLATAPAIAMADTMTADGDTAYSTSGALSTQTIVGEDDGNAVVVTNTLDNISPTGYIVEYAPVAVIAALAAGGIVLMVRSSRKKGDADEE